MQYGGLVRANCCWLLGCLVLFIHSFSMLNRCHGYIIRKSQCNALLDYPQLYGSYNIHSRAYLICHNDRQQPWHQNESCRLHHTKSNFSPKLAHSSNYSGSRIVGNEVLDRTGVIRSERRSKSCDSKKRHHRFRHLVQLLKIPTNIDHSHCVWLWDKNSDNWTYQVYRCIC